MRRIAALLAWSALVSSPTFGAPTEVRFEDEFVASGGGPVVFVQVPDDALLVFDKGPYDLDGRDLVVYAANAVVRGRVEIRGWDPAFVKPSPGGVPAVPPAPGDCGSTGCTGNPGATGNPGKAGDGGDPGPLMLLDLAGLEPADAMSTLVLTDAGQCGGKGQIGGIGGPGGTGGSGAGAGGLPCDNPCPEPGGQGGPGGKGGIGGQGGTGGLGGTIRLGSTLWSLSQSGDPRLSVSVAGGPGGPGGDPGPGGFGGSGGPRGPGSGPCTCPHPPGDGPQGPKGPPSNVQPPASVPGATGQVVELN